jgi:hypothetical protein
MLKKNIWANFQRIIELFTQKIVTMFSQIWVWDLGSGIRDPEKTYSGSRIQRSKRQRIPDPDPQHRKKHCRQKSIQGTVITVSELASKMEFFIFREKKETETVRMQGNARIQLLV